MTKEVFERLLTEKQYKAIKSIFDTMNPVDTAMLLPEFEDKQVVFLFRLIPKENASMVFSNIFCIFARQFLLSERYSYIICAS